MAPLFREFPVVVALLATSALGAWTSRYVRAGGGWWWTFLATIPSVSVWAWQAKYSKLPLVVSSALYDVVTATAWFLFAVYFGERMSLMQWAGVALLAIGLGLMNTK